MHVLSRRPNKILNIAHRAVARGAAGNTLNGIANSIAVGADGIEVDVQQTCDYKLILSHNRKILDDRRPTFVSELSWEKISRVREGGQQIPLLEEALLAVRNTELFLILDIKNIFEIGQLISLIRKYQMSEKVLVVSFDPRFLSKLKNAYPQVSIGIVVGFSRVARSVPGLILTLLGLLFPVGLAIRIGATAILCSDSFVTKKVVAKSHKEGIPIFVWQQSNRNDLYELINMRVDGIETYDPEKVVEVLKKWQREHNAEHCEADESMATTSCRK